MGYFLMRSVSTTCVDSACELSIVATYFHDFVYHGSLAGSAFSTVPFRMPIYAGESMQGYHFLYDLMLSGLLRLGFPLVTSYWYIMPFLYLVGISVVLLFFAHTLHKGRIFGVLLLLFFFIAGTFSYIGSILFKGSLFGFGVSSMLHTSTLFFYPTVGFSLIPVFIAWAMLHRGSLTRRRRLVLSVLLFLTLGLKFYAGVTLFVIMATYETVLVVKGNIWKEGRSAAISILMYAVSFLIALIVFYQFPSSLGKEPVFGWAPFAAVHQIIEDSYSYPMPDIAMARETLYSMGRFSPRLIIIEVLSLLIFIVHHFGTRVIGLVYLIWLLFRRKGSADDIAIAAGVVFSFLMGILFVQRGWHWWNTLQFHYYTAILLTVYLARFLYEVVLSPLSNQKSRKQTYLRLGIIIIIIFLTIPNTIEKVNEVRKTPKIIISSDDLAALEYLKDQPDGLVFTVPLMPETAYVSAFSNKQVYYADEQMLQNNGILYETRKEELMQPGDIDLNTISARYVYLRKDDQEYALFLRKAKETSYQVGFENDEIAIYSRDK